MHSSRPKLQLNVWDRTTIWRNPRSNEHNPEAQTDNISRYLEQISTYIISYRSPQANHIHGGKKDMEKQDL